MAHTDGMEQRIRTNPLNREPNGSRSNLFLIIESLDCRSASQFLPGRIVPMLSIYIYIFCDTHQKRRERSREMAFEYHLTFPLAATFQPTLPRFCETCKHRSAKGSNLRKFPLTRKKSAARITHRAKRGAESKRNKENQ